LLVVDLSFNAHEHVWYIFLMFCSLDILDEILITCTTICSVIYDIGVEPF